MSITSTAGATQTTPSATPTSTAKSLGTNEFLTLLTQQLKAQDPLNPMDSTNFTAQLAQFSSLEQLTNMNTTLSSVLTSQNSLQNTMTANFIGKKVGYDGNAINLNNNQATMNYMLSSAASDVKLSVYDASGTLVRTVALTNQSAGNQAYTWNGRSDSGSQLAAGSYTYAVTATDASGNTVTATPLSSGTVTGVVYDSTGTYLTLADGTNIRLGDIQEISGN